ncbi:Bowman-Birk type trypsin inhibitor, partial [Zea mays]
MCNLMSEQPTKPTLDAVLSVCGVVWCVVLSFFLFFCFLLF